MKVKLERIKADVFSQSVFERLKESAPKLVIADPPYGQIVSAKWDKTVNALAVYHALNALLSKVQPLGSTAYIWGGIGKRGNRPFLKWLCETNDLYDLITWRKKRAYGCPDRMLFTREECAMLVFGDKPNVFHVPYLDELRGYDGYDVKYPAKDKRLRRTNVWTDVTEILRGKTHPTQKPARLAEIMIETSTNPGDLVVDLFAGSCHVEAACKKLGRSCLSIDLEFNPTC